MIGCACAGCVTLYKVRQIVPDAFYVVLPVGDEILLTSAVKMEYDFMLTATIKELEEIVN